jgi:hypothetical protein
MVSLLGWRVKLLLFCGVGAGGFWSAGGRICVRNGLQRVAEEFGVQVKMGRIVG